MTARAKAAGGLGAVLGATAFAGAAGYAIQLLSASALPDAESYLAFSVFWSTMYLFGGAVGGVQQEFARATHPAAEPQVRNPATRFTIAAVGVVAVVAVALSAALGPVSFSAAPLSMSAAFVVGMIGYLLTSILTGILYGTGRAALVAVLIVTDASMRGVAVIVGLVVSAPPAVLAFAISIPFGASVILVWLFVRHGLRTAFTLDIGDRKLARNAIRTVGASTAVGVMVAGLPLLFNAFLGSASVAVASLVLVVTVTRAPLIIPLMALQSYLIVYFRDAGAQATRRMLQILAVVGGVAAVFMAVGAWLLPPIIAYVSQGRYRVDQITGAAVIASAALVGLMCVTSAALLASNRHNAYLVGWVVAAAATILALALGPADVVPRAMFALLCAPGIGLAAQAVMLVVRTRPLGEGER